MAYVIPADFATKTRKPWTQGLNLTESEGDFGTGGYIESVISQIQEQIENDLGDTFEPPSPDNDTTLEVHAYGGHRLFVPRRIRSITTLKTRDLNGVLTTETAAAYRVTQSATGADFTGNVYDYVDIVSGQSLTTGSWPYGAQTVQLTGKFGWASTPTDIKRLTALLVYDYIKPKDHPLMNIERRTTVDSVIEYGEPQEIADIKARYSRQGVLVR